MRTPHAQPGVLYQHYKGGRYLVTGVGRLSEERETVVVIYVSLTTGQTWVRPLCKQEEDSWTDMLTWPDGVQRARFIPDETAKSTPSIIEAFIGKD